MNSVQSYTPPRRAALLIGGLVFALYQTVWRDILLARLSGGDEPVPLILAIVFSGIIGYGVAMLGWLIVQTKSQISLTFRPTRGRILAALIVPLLMPFAVFNYVPWVIGGLMFLWVLYEPLTAVGLIIVATAVAYPVTSMIVRHTYRRRWLRFALFCLAFWSAYSILMLARGQVAFHL